MSRSVVYEREREKERVSITLNYEWTSYIARESKCVYQYMNLVLKFSSDDKKINLSHPSRDIDMGFNIDQDVFSKS